MTGRILQIRGPNLHRPAHLPLMLMFVSMLIFLLFPVFLPSAAPASVLKLTLIVLSIAISNLHHFVSLHPRAHNQYISLLPRLSAML